MNLRCAHQGEHTKQEHKAQDEADDPFFHVVCVTQ
jgi:hypothetical protein